MIKAIIFDYDGVMVDSFPAVHKVYQIICSKLGKECPLKLSLFKKVYGKRSRECMHRLHFTAEDVEKANKIYVKEIQKQDTPFFPGVVNVVKRLCKQYPLFLVSSSPYLEVKGKLKKAGLADCFVEIVGGKLGSLEKVPELIKLLQRHNLKKKEVAMIGDRINDYIDAKNTGIKHILLVEYGWGYDKKEIPEHRQTVTIKRPEDIRKAVEMIE